MEYVPGETLRGRLHQGPMPPREALGMVMRLPERDSYSYHRDKMHANLSVSMGGRVAEELIFGHDKVSSPAFQYFFTKKSRAIPAWGAHHAAELGYVFNTFMGFGPATEPTDEDRALGAAMIGYWSQFAKTGDPNSDGRPTWPAFEPGTETYLELGDQIRTGARLGKESCDALDAVIAKLNG